MARSNRHPGDSMLRSTALLLAAALGGCVAADTDDSFGHIDLALVGQAGDGTAYRLRDASIAVAGPTGTLTFATEDDPDRTAITRRLATGTYALELGGSWRLERLAGTTATPVTATLLSSNPQSFTIDTDALTRVSLRFGVPGGEVQLGEGDLAIGVDVDVLPEPQIQAIVPGATAIGVGEGNTAIVSLRLAAAPTSDTEVWLTSADPTRMRVAPSRVLFTPATWNQPQFAQVTGLGDDDVVNSEPIALHLSTAGVPEAIVAVTVVDIDRMSVVLEPTGFQVEEGENLALGVRLSHRPAATTTVTVVASDAAALFVSPDTLTFTADDWSTAKYTSLQAPLDADRLSSSVTITALIDAATATQMTVQVIDTTLDAIGWPVSTLDLDTVPSSLITAYQVVLDAPFDLRRLQLDGTSPSSVHVGLYDDAGGRPGSRLASAAPIQLVGVSDPVRVDVHEGSVFLPLGAYWLVVAGNAPLTTSTVPVPALRCRGTWLGGGLPGFLGGAALTCGHAPAIGIAGLGQTL
jgi:hypothetical protein